MLSIESFIRYHQCFYQFYEFFSLQNNRGEQVQLTYLDETRVMLKYSLPLSEIVIDFYDKLKSLSSGYARYSILVPRA